MNVLPQTEFSSKQSAGSRWLVVAVTLLIGLVFLTDEHRWDRSGLKDYVESAEERADAAVSGNSLRRLAFLTLGCAGTMLLLISGRLPVVREPLGLSLLLAASWTFASLLWADSATFTLKRLLLILLCVGGIVGVASVLSLRQLAAVTLIVTGSYLVLGVAAEVLQGNFRPWAGGYRFAGTLHPNAQSTNCGALALSAMALWRGNNEASSHTQRIVKFTTIAGAAFLVGIAFLFLTKSRTAMAAILLVIGLIWTTKQRFGSNLIVAGSGVLAVAALCFAVFASGMGGNVDDAANYGRADSQGALNGRLPIWEICVRRVGPQMPIGFGYDGFWTPERIESVSWELGWSISSAHSEYIEIALGLGVIGLGLYVVVQTGGIIWFWMRYLRLGHGGDAMIFGLLTVGAIQGFMETSYLHPSALTPFIALSGMSRLAFFTDHSTQWNGVV